MIVINPKCEIQVERCVKDKSGRVVILDTKVDDTHLILANIYAPNDNSQQVTFFKNLQQQF